MVPLLASKRPGTLQSPPPIDKKHCKWWQSPVVIGGTGGSGTRGVVERLKRLGLYVLGSDPKLCRANVAGDTSCMDSCVHGSSRDDLAIIASMKSRRSEWRNLSSLVVYCGTSTGAQHVLHDLPLQHRRPWRWSWKHPSAVMYSLPSLRAVFPCMHYIHVLRLPMDMAAAAFEHVGNRAAEMQRVAAALGYMGASQRGAAAYLCNGDKVCLRIIGPLNRDAPNIGASATSPEWEQYVGRSLSRMTALRCWHLLLWSHVNALVVQWAQHVLGDRGSLLLWPSEHLLNSSSQVATRMLTSLHHDVLRQPQRGSASAGRRLEYGKWMPHSSEQVHMWRNLTHCGPWVQLLPAFGYQVPSSLQLRTASAMHRLCPTCVR